MERKLNNERNINQEEIRPNEQLTQTASNALKHSQFSFTISLWKAKNHISTISFPLFWSRPQYLADVNGKNLLFWLQLLAKYKMFYFLDISRCFSLPGENRRTLLLWTLCFFGNSTRLVSDASTNDYLRHEQHLDAYWVYKTLGATS